MEWKMFVNVVMGLVNEFNKMDKKDVEGRGEVYLRVGRLIGDEMLRESWRDGKGGCLLGVCGNDWNWNYKLERLERFDKKVNKLMRWN